MALTYMPNANEVPKASSGRTALPIVAGLVALVLIVVAAWFVLGGSKSPSTAAPLPVSHAPVAGAAGASAQSAGTIYGTDPAKDSTAQDERFKVAFNSTPSVEADTGGMVENFPAHTSVSTYVVSASPNGAFQNDPAAAVPTPTSYAYQQNPVTVPTYVVTTATLPSGLTYLGTPLDPSFAAAQGIKQITRDGFTGYVYEQNAAQAAADGIVYDTYSKLPNPEATVVCALFEKGSHAYMVAAVTDKAADAEAFLASFHPVTS